MSAPHNPYSVENLLDETLSKVWARVISLRMREFRRIALLFLTTQPRAVNLFRFNGSEKIQ